MVNKHNYAFIQRKDELHYIRDDFSPASLLHVSIILRGGGLGGLCFLGIRNAALCPRRYKHLCCVQKEEKIYSLSPAAKF